MFKRSTLFLLMLAGCAAPAAPGPVLSEPAPSPSASSPVQPTQTPSVAPSASASSAFSLMPGKPLKAYDFQDLRGLGIDPQSQALFALDAVDKASSPRRYTLRRFAADGSFLGDQSLAPQYLDPPKFVDALFVDRRGVPLYTYRNENDADLYFRYGSGPSLAEDLPFSHLEKVRLVALGGDGAVYNEAALMYPYPDAQYRLEDGSISYGRREEGEAPLALFRFADPYRPTMAMAFGPEGKLFIAGAKSSGEMGVSVVGADQKVVELNSNLGFAPSGLWADGAKGLFVAQSSPSGTAKLTSLNSAGTKVGDVELKLDGGGYLNDVRGLVLSGEKKLVVAGAGYDATGKPIVGLYAFERP